MRFTVLLVALAVLTSGCASIVRGASDSVTVTADRDSAFVFVDGVPAGVTPVRVGVRRSRSHRIDVVLDSFRVAQTPIDRSLNPAVAVGSLVLGGLGGLAVDVSTGAVFDLDPEAVHVVLVPDSAGVDAPLVADLMRRARQATPGGFAEADPWRRSAPPWLTLQLAAGTYLGGTPGDDRGVTTGGIGSSVQVGVRGRWTSARLSATGSGGFLFDNSERWEVAALVGVVTEAADGRFRFGLAAGPGLAGGRESNACLLFCDGSPRSRRALPTRLGVSVLGEAHVFITPRVGLGIHVPTNLRRGDPLRGVMFGWRFEGF